MILVHGTEYAARSQHYPEGVVLLRGVSQAQLLSPLVSHPPYVGLLVQQAQQSSEIRVSTCIIGESANCMLTDNTETVSSPQGSILLRMLL
jgi:hypothetical protein